MNGFFEFISKLQLPAKIIFGALLIVSGLILFLPLSVLKVLGLDSIEPYYRTILGITFLISFTMTILLFVSDFINNQRRKKLWTNRKNYLNKILKNKNSDEYELITYLYQNGMEAKIPVNTKTALYLQTNRVIDAPPQTVYTYDPSSTPIKYIVQPWAAEIIENHFKLGR